MDAGSKTLTLTGANTGTNIFAGNIVNNGGTTALTKSGMDLWVLTGNNTFTGAFTLNNGTVRISSANNLGSGSYAFGSGSTTGLPLLELRADSGFTFARNMTNNAGTNETILVDRAIGGTGVNQTMTLGAIAQNTSTAQFFAIGDHGYSLAVGVNTVKGGNGQVDCQ